MPDTQKEFLQGNEIAARAALNAGATQFFGYPITPSSEIFETWVKLVGNPKNPSKSPLSRETLKYLQCEDEMSSGFAMIGACMAGQKSFTATAGPGNILMQDAFVAAEALRIPTVALIMQRGGMSTSTVIYSQEEVTLTCLGGNGEGFRIVYSPAGLQELYDYTVKAFNSAWKYRFPTFVLGDGYQGKMYGQVEIKQADLRSMPKPEPILGKGGKPVNLRNCYDEEEEINEIITKYNKEFEATAKKVAESEEYNTQDANTLIIAHGIVATAAKVAVDLLRSEGKKVGLWRPITLRPLDQTKLLNSIKGKTEVIFVESALGQLARLVKDEMGNNLTRMPKSANFRYLYKPALGITPKEIYQFTKKYAK